MNITPIQKVRAAYIRSIELGASHDEAVEVTAAILCLPVESVHAVVNKDHQEAMA